MQPKKQKDGRWKTDFKPDGQHSKRYRKTFDTRGEALNYQRYIISKYTKEWSQQKENRKLSEIIELWFQNIGLNLASGNKRKRTLINICLSLNDPIVSTIQASSFIAYRASRLNDGISKHTVNRELAYLKSLFNSLIKGKFITCDNPYSEIQVLRVQEKELTYLTSDQIIELIHQLKESTNHSALPVAEICLMTGCRWSEAESLRGENIQNWLIQFSGTKSYKNRSVPVDHVLFSSIDWYRETGELFTSCYSAFRKALERCSFDLPKGQLTHVLRHTFSSHFMMNGGNILVLKTILGHASLQMTMKYSHFSPDHLSDAMHKNPMNDLIVIDGLICQKHGKQ